MNTSGIGVRRILRRSGTAWQVPNSPPTRSDAAADRDQTPDDKPGRAPPEPGTGQLVDRNV
jgi:hypothetical protein